MRGKSIDLMNLCLLRPEALKEKEEGWFFMSFPSFLLLCFFHRLYRLLVVCLREKPFITCRSKELKKFVLWHHSCERQTDLMWKKEWRWRSRSMFFLLTAFLWTRLPPLSLSVSRLESNVLAPLFPLLSTDREDSLPEFCFTSSLKIPLGERQRFHVPSSTFFMRHFPP